MEVDLHKVTLDEMKSAFWVWFNYHDMTYGNAVRAFYKFTGTNSFLDSQHVTEEKLLRIRRLGGPNGHALLAMHYAQGTSEEVV